MDAVPVFLPPPDPGGATISRSAFVARAAVAAAGAVLFGLAACGGDDGPVADTAAPAPATEVADPAPDDAPTIETTGEPTAEVLGGTLIWAHEQEPPDLHFDDPENSLTTTSWVLQSMIEGLYGVSGSTEFIPELLANEAVVVQNDNGSVTASYELRDGLTWSDGTRLTAADVEFSFEVFVAADGVDEEGAPAYVYLLADRAGYDSITDFTVVTDTEFSVTWSSFYSGWKTLFSRVYPSHVFSDDPVVAAAELNDALRDWTTADGTVIPSSGPMLFDSWEKGVQMNLVRNDDYHGSVSPDVVRQGEIAAVDGVQINYVTDTDAQINALLAGEAQIVFTQPQLAFEDLASNEDFTVASLAGPVFEHWGFNLYNAHLAKPEVREALAFAMDKSEVMTGLYAPLFGDSLPADGLGNTYWMSNQPDYVDHAGEAGYGAGDVASARAVLEDAGYALNDDGVFEHPDDGVLSLRVGTTGGNRLREIQQELIQAQMADAGIEILIDNVEGAAYIRERPAAPEAMACSTSGGTEGNCDIWDITQFAWRGGPWPGGQTAAYRAGSVLNPYGFANDEFEARADECEATLDDAARAVCYNDLDTFVTTLDRGDDGLFMLPITQKPSFYGCTTELAVCAVAPDAKAAGPLANVVDFVFAG